MSGFRMEIRFDDLPPESWLKSFFDGREVRVEIGEQMFDGMYKITHVEVDFQDVTPRFTTRLVLVRQGPL